MKQNKALVVIDIQNDITKHYRDIIDNINATIEWAVAEGIPVVYIKHNNITAGTRTFKPGSKGEELVPEMKVVSDNIFVKTKSNALTSEAFSVRSWRGCYRLREINVFQHGQGWIHGACPLRLHHQLRPEETPRDARLLRKQRLRFSVSRLERSSKL